MIKRLSNRNVLECAKLGKRLWPETSIMDLKTDFYGVLDDPHSEIFTSFNNDNMMNGFIQLSIRQDYVEGCEASPVGYIEGIFVNESDRHLGVASALVKKGEAWVKDLGIHEIGSDCILENTVSIDFHKHIGFKEANRLVCFIKKI